MTEETKFLGLSKDVLYQSLILTILCAIPPLFQIASLSILKCLHPTTMEKEGRQEMSVTKAEFQKIARSILPQDASIDADGGLRRAWLTEATNLVGNNYQTSDIDDAANNPTRTKDKVLLDFPSSDLVNDIGSLPYNTNYQTQMMKVVNHHIMVLAWMSILQQLNVGLSISEETTIKKKRLTLGPIIDELRTITDKPRFPKCLNYRHVRNMKDNKDVKGLKLTPVILAEKPWIQLRDQLHIYMNSYLMDVTLHWVKIWFGLVLLKIVVV